MALRANPTAAYREGVLVQAPALPGRHRMSPSLWREASVACSLLTPALLVILIFVAYPFFSTFVMIPTSISVYLNQSDKDLQKATGLFPVPAGPKGVVNQIDTWAFGAFQANPHPELARGLLEYYMKPENYNKIVESTGGRWVPVYKRLFETPFWREKPEFKHFIHMAETGVPVSYAGSPTLAAGEVLNTHLIPKMIQRVLVDNWAPAKALGLTTLAARPHAGR